MTLDDTVVAELERLNQAATQGPWKPDPKDFRCYVWGGDGHMVADNITDGQEREGQLARLRGAGAEVSGQRPSGENDANYDLIIAMRNALPGMLQELRSLRAKVAGLHSAVVAHLEAEGPCANCEDGSDQALCGDAQCTYCAFEHAAQEHRL